MICPNCNNDVKDGMRFCPKCGTKIESISFCTKCGKELEANAAFCMYCGAPTKATNPSNEARKSNTSQESRTNEKSKDEEYVLLEKKALFWNVNSSLGRMSGENGTIIITNQRILLYKHSTTTKLMLGALGDLTSANVLAAEIPVKDISNIETKRPLGLTYNFIVSTSTGMCYGIAGNEEIGKKLNDAIIEGRISHNKNDEAISSEEALTKLKRAKDKLDLGLITKVEFDVLKAELGRYID